MSNGLANRIACEFAVEERCLFSAMSERTAMFVDIQGFAVLYGGEHDSLWGLSELMRGVYLLGTEAKRLGISRLFAHHIGDGFVLVDDGGTANVTRLVSVAVALHQFTLIKAGHFCASAIERGEMADVMGCYPEEVCDARSKYGALPLGDGLMTVFPVMGTAIIRTVKLQAKAHAAAILLPAVQAVGLEDGVSTTSEGDNLYVDWVGSMSPTIKLAREIMGIDRVTSAQLAAAIDASVLRNNCKPDWTVRTWGFLSRL